MAGYCTLVLYFHSPAARENTTAHSCNIQPYCPLTHQIIYMYSGWKPMIAENLWKTPSSIVAYRNYHAESSKSMQSNFLANCNIQSIKCTILCVLAAAYESLLHPL